MISGIQKISVYDPATGTTVQLNNIVPEGNAKIKVPISVKDVDGLNYFDGEDSLFSFGVWDNEGFEQLYDWMIAGTKLRFVALGIEQNLLWNESSYILVNRGYGFKSGSRNPFLITFARKRGTHSIQQFTNLIRTGGKWEDANSDEKADCLTFTGAGTYTFYDTEEYQYMLGGMEGDQAKTGTIVFPFSGVKMFAKLNWKSGSLQNWQFVLEARSFADALLDSASVFDSDDVLELILPANTYSVKIRINVEDTKNVKFYLPYLGAQRDNYLDINY